MKRISVVMTTYNGAIFLRKQIDSILSQTRKPDEIVIVDDASTDNTYDILEEYQSRFPGQIIVSQNVSNLGIINNFEKAAKISSGDLIFFSDQDDVWDSEKIQVMIDAINDSSLLYSNAVIVDENELIMSGDELEFIGVPVIQGKPLPYLLESNSISGHNLVVTRELLDAAIPFYPNIFYDQWLGVVACLQNGIKFIDNKLVKHRMHSMNAMNNPVLRAKLENSSPKVRKLDIFRKRSDLSLRLMNRISEIGSSDDDCMKIVRLYVDHLSFAKTCFFNRKFYKALLSTKFLSSINMPEKKLKKRFHRMSRGELYFRIFRY